jgi:D-3-phosphoglycerate dehydrogenase
MPVVLCSAPYMTSSLERFRPTFDKAGIELIVPDVKERLQEAELLAHAGRFDGAICGDDHYTARVLSACAPRLKVIVKWGTGIDSIDSEACARLGIQLFRTPNAFTVPVADSVLGYILAFARKQPWMDREMKAGKWEKLPGRALSECTLGVVGVGNIGKAVVRRARAFQMGLLGNDIIDIDPDFVAETGLEMTTLEDLLSRSDYISLNCDLNPTSLHLLNEQRFARLKPTAVLINTARGPIVDEHALVRALGARRLAGAALDVFAVEPLPPDSPLLKMDNVLLAPHNSNSSPAAWETVHWNTLNSLFQGLGIPQDGLLPNP